MQLKPITALIVLLLVVASLLVAGCSTTSNTNQTPSASATPSTATHNATLERFLTEYKNRSNILQNDRTFKAWEVTWINSTSARIEYAWQNKTQNNSYSAVDTFTIFPTTQDATQYLNSMNMTVYSLASTQYTFGAYQIVTGHAPQVYKQYVWNEGNSLDISAFTRHEIIQYGDIVEIYTARALG